MTGPWAAGTFPVECENAPPPLQIDAMQILCSFTYLHYKEYEVRSGLNRLGLGGGLFALQISGAPFAFFDFVVLLPHKSLHSEVIPVV